MWRHKVPSSGDMVVAPPAGIKVFKCGRFNFPGETETFTCVKWFEDVRFEAGETITISHRSEQQKKREKKRDGGVHYKKGKRGNRN